MKIHSLRGILIGISTSFLLLIIGSLLVSFIYLISNVVETTLQFPLYLFGCTSVLFGGVIAGANSRLRGWQSGLIVGLLFLVICFFIQKITRSISFQQIDFLWNLILLCSSVIGGMFGVFLQQEKSSEL